MVRRQKHIHSVAWAYIFGGSSARVKRKLGFAIVVLATALCSLLFAQPALAQSGVISGTVTELSSTPIENITVDLYIEQADPIFGTSWSLAASTNTLANGAYSFSGLSAGTYGICFVDANTPAMYKNECYDEANELGFATKITLAANETLSNLDAQLAKFGTISGRATVVGGGPLPNAQVGVYVYETCCAVWTFIGSYPADNDGNYTVTQLGAATYRLQFQDSAYPPMYQSEFYADASDVDSATDIPVGDGEDVVGIDGELAKTGSIAGRVTAANANPIDNMRVELYEYNSLYAFWSLLYSVHTDSSGYYTHTGLSAGTFRIGFVDEASPAHYQNEFYSDAESVETATDIQVMASQDVVGIDAQLAKFGSISGHVIDKDSNPIAGLSATVYENDAFLYTTVTDENGAYTIAGLQAGNYKVGFENYIFSGNPIYQREFYDDASTLAEATTVPVGEGEDVTGIDAQMANLSSISGRVTDESGAPLPFIQVLVNADSEVGCCNPATTQTDDNGQYTVSGLPAASYRVEFDDSFSLVYETEYYSDAHSYESATLVTVGLSEDITGIDAQLAKLGSMSGKVVDEAGNPLANISVSLYQEETDPCCAGSWSSRYGTNTDSDGLYTFGGLTAGKYRLFFSEYSSPPLYQHEFYDNAFTLETATDIVMARSQELVMPDVELAKPASISGHITDSDGQPASDWCAFLRYFNPSTKKWELINSDCQYDAGDDTYVINSVPVGTFRMEFARSNTLEDSTYRREFYNNVFTIEEADDIVVTSGLVIENIDAMLDKRTHIGGRVTDGANKALENISVGVYKRGADTPDGGQTWELVTSDTTDGNGDYTMYDLPAGSYRVGFSNGNALYKTEYFNNVYYVQNGQDVVLAEGGVADNINAQLEGITLNVPPLAVHDALTVNEGGTVGKLVTNAASVLANDQDAENGTLSAALVTPPVHGALTLNADGTFSYVHDGSETTSDQFVYRASDGVNNSPVISVTITIQPVNDAPVAASDAMTVTRGGTTSQLTSGANLLTNDSDAEGSPLTAVLVEQPRHGALTLQADGTFTYTQDGSAAAGDSFTYIASDGQAQSAATVVTITVVGSSKPQPAEFFSYLPLSYR